MTYDLKPMHAPRAAGGLLKLFTFLVENPVTSKLLGRKLLGDAGILAMRDALADEALPVDHPIFSVSTSSGADPQAVPVPAEATKQSSSAGDFAYATCADFVAAYTDGRTTPDQIAQRVLECTQASEAQSPAMRVFIAQDADDVMAQANAATERYKAGTTLGPLDGVPVAVKDELDQLPYCTTVGTRFLGKTPPSDDAEVVRRLRQAGAVLIGKANMHEVGMGVTGLNPHHGSARNPYNPAHATGGSSSGPAAAVASGLCPLAVGADGGGSIRIPASLTGIVGLKATYGRISEYGAAPLCWSLAHVGPMGATARDTALGYMLMAGKDPRDPNTRYQSTRHLNTFGNGNLSGLKLGIFRPWFEDAEPEVVQACAKMLDGLKDAGAEIVDVTIPELGLLRTVHLVSIICEMATSHLEHYRRHRKEYGLDTRLNMALARQLQAYDYVHAQRHRVRLVEHFARVLKSVDCLVTPATGRTAPVLPKDALKTGEANLTMVGAIMRFAPAPNLTGYPAISFPAGYDAAGLPIGFQVIGRPWEEDTLLRCALVGEGLIERQAPKVHYDLLAS